MISSQYFPFSLILGSASPRRKELLSQMGFAYTVSVKEIDESYPKDIPAEDVPLYLAEKKAKAHDLSEYPTHAILITADTMVMIDGEILGKPADREDAIAMIQKLSGKTHKVITGICLTHREKQVKFSAVSEVTFRQLQLHEIEYYVDTCDPYDKAGSYGIQEWLGMVALDNVKGSFFNVVGLPTQRLYQALMDF